MLQRIVTGLVSVLLLVAVLIFRGWVLRMALMVVAVWGMSEIFDAFENAGFHPVRWTAMLAAALMIPAYMELGVVGFLPLLMMAAVLSMLVIMLRQMPDWTDISTTLYAMMTVLLPVSLLQAIEGAQPPELGALLFFGVFVVAMFGDIAALFVGVTIGKRKLNPLISPNKTWEGAAGGLLGSMLGGAFLYALGSNWTMMPPLWHLLLLGLLGGAAGQMGDLAASLVKRWCGIKDFGVVFPGHGGIMDRFDSILFTAYVVYIYCVLCVF